MIDWSNFSPAGDELTYLLDAYESGWVSGGDYVARLEDALKESFSARCALAVSNGTAALQLAYQTVNAKMGDEVIVPAFCFQAAANVAIQLGLRPVFCDVDERTWNQSVETIERSVTENTAGIVVVHNYGRVAPIAEIAEFARARGIWVIEDCAEAWFSKYQDRFVGQFGQVATFSMHATKTIACGEGGVVLVNDESMVERSKLLRSHGLARKERHYYHLLAGNNYRLSNLLCAIAFGQFEKRDLILAKQRRNLAVYRRNLGESPGIEMQEPVSEFATDEVWATAVSVPYRDLDIDRDQMIRLLAERGVEVRPGFYPASSIAHLSPYLHTAAERADKLAASVVVLPTNGSISEDEARTVCDELIDITVSHRKP